MYAEYIAGRQCAAVKTRLVDIDEAAGESDALLEDEGEEETPREQDEILEFPQALPDEPVLEDTAPALCDKPLLLKQGPLKMASSQSLGSVSIAPTIITPSRSPGVFPGLASGAITPSPVSPPVITKEVLLIVDTPKKCVKAEPFEDEGFPPSDGIAEAPVPEPPVDKEAMMRELALLEAQLLLTQLMAAFLCVYVVD